MLYLNPNQEKILTFEVELSGANCSEVNGFVRFFISDEVQLGFPVTIEENQIQAVIAPLKKLVKKSIKNGTIFEAQLDLYTEEKDYFSPWKGEIEIKMPITIEAKIKDDDDKTNLSERKNQIKVKSVSEQKIPEKKEQIVEDVNINKEIKTTNEKTPRLPKKDLVTEEDLKKHIDEKFIYRYMTKVGTKNSKIQDIVYEQATSVAGGDQYKVLKEVIKILGKNKIKNK